MLSFLRKSSLCKSCYQSAIKSSKLYHGRYFSTITPPSSSSSSSLIDNNLTQNPENLIYGSHESIQMKLKEKQIADHIYNDEMDLGNSISALKPIDEENTSNIFEIINQLRPSHIYEEMDVLSRDLLIYLANDLGWGMGWSILAITMGIKLLFGPIILLSQINAQKTKLIEPETKNFQAVMQRCSRTGDYEGMKIAQAQFRLLREKVGISTMMPLFSLAQIPFLVTWFLSLRYVASIPDKFPGMKTEGFFWFKDLSQYDPYFIIPLFSACFSYYNISISAVNSNTAAMGSTMARYMRYFKYVPFLSLPIVIFFPSSITLYWAVSALFHLLITMIVRNQKFKQLMKIPDYLPGTILEKMHGMKKPNIVKAVMNDNSKQATVNVGGMGSGEALNVGIRGGQAELKKQLESSTGGKHAKMEVFSQKPKKVK